MAWVSRMFGGGRKAAPSPFAAALRAYGWSRCGVKDRTLFVGLAAGSFKPPPVAEPLGADLPMLDAVIFCDAPDQGDVIAALLADPLAAALTHLEIGSSLDAAGSGQRDYREAVAHLAAASLPALRSLRLGDMFRTYNGDPIYGTVGEFGPALAAAPGLERLDLCGAIALSAPIRHARLQEIALIAVDFVAGEGGMPDQSTMDALLTSDVPALTRLWLELDIDDTDTTYSLPAAFLRGDTLPALERRHFLISHIAAELDDALSARKTLMKG